MRKPLIDTDGTVVNIIEIEDGANYQPDTGLTMLAEHPDAAIGGTYNPKTKTFTPPPEPEPPAPTEIEQLRELVDQLAAAGIIDQAVEAGTITRSAATAAGIELAPAPIKGKVS